MRDVLREHPAIRVIVITTLVLLALMVALYVVTWPGGDTTVQEAEAADPAEQNYPPGMIDVVTGQPDEKGRYIQTVYGVEDLDRRAERRMLADWSSPGVSWPATGIAEDWYKRAHCRRAWEHITLNSVLGTNLAKTRHELWWCWNGNKVIERNPSLYCDVLGWGAAGQWSVKSRSRNGFFKPWGGSGQGAFEDQGRCEYQQKLPTGWVINQRQHYSRIVGFGNGGYQFP